VHCQGREISLRPNTPQLQSSVLRALLDAGASILSLNPRGNALEELYLSVVRGAPITPPEEPPPNGLFAPPGHPDATVPGKAGMGDTLLRALLGREDDRRRQADDDEKT
jgi:hypothetical protein